MCSAFLTKKIKNTNPIWKVDCQIKLESLIFGKNGENTPQQFVK
jgi:hypothetical protein